MKLDDDARALLRQGADALERGNWSNAANTAGDCAFTIIIPKDRRESAYENEVRKHACKIFALFLAARTTLKYQSFDRPQHLIWSWNDFIAKTKEEVVAAMQAAAAEKEVA